MYIVKRLFQALKNLLAVVMKSQSKFLQKNIYGKFFKIKYLPFACVIFISMLATISTN